MEKDNLPKEEEISAEELDQVNGGLTATNLTATNFLKMTSTTASLDYLKIETTIQKI